MPIEERLTIATIILVCILIAIVLLHWRSMGTYTQRNERAADRSEQSNKETIAVVERARELIKERSNRADVTLTRAEAALGEAVLLRRKLRDLDRSA